MARTVTAVKKAVKKKVVSVAKKAVKKKTALAAQKAVKTKKKPEQREPRAWLFYMGADGKVVKELFKYECPPERLCPYGAYKGPPPPGGRGGKILDMKAVMR